MLCNFKASLINFCDVMHTIQDRMRSIMQSNRAKMNFLQLAFD